MGECGCGELIPHEILRLGENILIVEIYRGCEYCDTGIMVTMHLKNVEDAEEFGYVATGEFKLDEFGFAQKNYPIIGNEDLIDACKELGADEAIKHYEKLTDYLEDHGLELLQKAVQLSTQKVTNNE